MFSLVRGGMALPRRPAFVYSDDGLDQWCCEGESMAALTAIRLGKDDNVAVVTSDVRPGADLKIGDLSLQVRDPIPFGHKIALVPMAEGDRVVKFGVPIGRAMTAIAAGDHVHVHNIQSDYINNAVDHYEA